MMISYFVFKLQSIQTEWPLRWQIPTTHWSPLCQSVNQLSTACNSQRYCLQMVAVAANDTVIGAPPSVSVWRLLDLTWYTALNSKTKAGAGAGTSKSLDVWFGQTAMSRFHLLASMYFIWWCFRIFVLLSQNNEVPVVQPLNNRWHYTLFQGTIWY